MLTPRDPWAAPELAILLAGLQRCGFVGPAFDRAGTAWLAGEEILIWISFTGCSPHIRLEPPAEGSGPFCHIRLQGPYGTPRLLWGRNTRPPRCPRCRATLGDWSLRRSHWEAAPERSFPCPHCGEAVIPLGLAWRENGGFGRLFLAVEDVFPGEAVPVPALFERLEELSGGPWRHFYLQEQVPGLSRPG